MIFNKSKISLLQRLFFSQKKCEKGSLFYWMIFLNWGTIAYYINEVRKMMQMEEKLQHKQLHFHFFEGKKFKTNVIGILLRTPLSREQVTKTSLLAEVMKNGSMKYPSKQAVAIKNEEMYGSVFDVSILKKGDEQILFFYLEFIKCNEDLLEEGIQFLLEMIKQPYAPNNAFPEKTITREKRFLSKKIQSRKDNKKEYAKIRCLEEMCEGEAFGIYADGYEEDLEKIDGQNLYQHYQQIRKKASIEVLFMGEEEQKRVAEKKLKDLELPEADLWTLPHMKPQIQNRKRKEIKEAMSVAQSRLCIGFTTGIAPDSKDVPTLLVLSEILGGSASSLLFEEMREKEGLCYYVNSFLYRLKGILFVQAGIEADSYEKAISITEDLLKKLQIEKLNDQRLEFAKEGLLNYYAQFADSQTAQMDFSVDEYLAGTNWSQKRFLNKIDRVSAEDIRRVAQGMQLDTIYFLKGEAE